jgi:hypothetical protein
MSFNGGKVVLGIAVVLAVALAAGFVLVNFFGVSFA